MTPFFKTENLGMGGKRKRHFSPHILKGNAPCQGEVFLRTQGRKWDFSQPSKEKKKKKEKRERGK